MAYNSNGTVTGLTGRVPPKVVLGFVAVVDLLVAVTAVIFSIMALADCKAASIYFMISGTSNDVLQYGLIVLPLTSVIWLCNSLWLVLISSSAMITLGVNSCYFLKSFTLFSIEICGFVIPYYSFTDYIPKMDNILRISDNFRIFNLLKISLTTISLFGWQFCSFLLVHHFQKKLISRNTNRGWKPPDENTLTPLESVQLNHLQAAGAASTCLPSTSAAICLQ